MAPIHQGHAELQVASVRGRSTVIRACARNPLRLLTPRASGQSVWAYTSSFGGGMVTGDINDVRIDIESNSKCFFSTQSSTKIYKALSARSCTQKLRATLGENSLLILAPDPIQAFAGARYHQDQSFELTETSNLIVVDWLSAGRTARGERWAFAEYANRNNIMVAGKRILSDAISLNAQTANLSMTTGGYNCFGTVILVGLGLESETSKILQRVSEISVSPGADPLISASPILGGVIIKLASNSVETAGRTIHSFLSFVPTLLCDNPWARKW